MADSSMIRWETGPDGKLRPIHAPIMAREEYYAYRAQVFPVAVESYEDYVARRQPKEQD